MTFEEFDALCVTIAGCAGPDGDQAVADAMQSHRTTVRRWRNGQRAVPGPVQVLAPILADRAEAEAAEEARQVRKTIREQGR